MLSDPTTLLPYVQVAVNVPRVAGVFDYHLPPELLDDVVPGSLVVVPFGRAEVQGIVLRRVAEASVVQVRAVSALLDPLPVLTLHQLRLAEWMARETLAPLAACLELMLPPGLSQQADTLYEINPTPPASSTALTAFQQKLLAELRERGSLRGRQIDAAFPHVEWKGSAQALARRGVLRARSVLPPPTIRPKLVRTAQLICPPDQFAQRLGEVSRPNTPAYARRMAVLEFLRHEPLPVNLPWIYASSGANAADINRLAEAGMLSLGESEIWRDPLSDVTPGSETPPELTAAQTSAWEAIQAGINAAASGTPPGPYLLHGVTGSGKTEIYLRAVAETLRTGRQAIVLVPEIALTPQTVRRFLTRFPGQVGLIHSRLSNGERYDTWRRARAGQIPIIVGPRSALLTPLPNPGLIVLDECHDESYFQTEGQPYYSAVEAALAYAEQTGSLVMLGSATPNVSQMFRARREDWNILSLPLRILAHRDAVNAYASRTGIAPPPDLEIEAGAAAMHLPAVEVVDMRQELKSGNRSIFSRPLKQAVETMLAANQQAILFLNRRGTATYVFCRDCGNSLRCPRCDRPLVQHLRLGNGDLLTCHTCNYRRQMPKKCPICASTQIRQYGTGTEKVESEVQAAFPGARTLRWDAETVREKGSHEILLSHFMNHQADILIGTQMLAKGLDLPLVTLVGVILADVGLNLDDYRAGERTFQLLTQVAGRAGRSLLGGRVVLQTFQPEHYAIQAAAEHDYAGFYQQEVRYRREMNYPPYTRLARLEFRGPDAAAVEAAATKTAALLQQRIETENYAATSLIGPVPCFFSKHNGQFRWQVVVRGPDPAAVLRAHPGDLPSEGVSLQIDPPSLL